MLLLLCLTSNSWLCSSSTTTIAAIVSFGKVAQEHKDAAVEFGVNMYTWNEFLQLGSNKRFELPEKKKTDICTIMYTSGTTGDPKGVLISNESILSMISGVNHQLESMNEEVCTCDQEDILSFNRLRH